MSIYFQTAKEVSLKYTLLSDFQNNDIGFLNWIRLNYSFSEFCPHIIIDTEFKKLIKSKWSIEKAHKIALNYEMKEDLVRGCIKVMSWARRNNLVDFITSHMKTPYEEWTIEKLNNLAKKCSSRYEFEKKYKAAYIHAGRIGVLDDICSHMKIAYGGFDKSKKAILYYVKFIKGSKTLYKVGISNFSVKERFRKEKIKMEVIKVIEFEKGIDAKNLETKILKDNKDFLYKGVNILKSGNTELFNFDVMEWDQQ
jgi:hypothetical protein